MQAASPTSQVINGIAIVAVIFIVFFTSEILVKAVNTYHSRFVNLLDSTASSEDMAITIRQDASVFKDAIPIGISINERTGIEFSYSFYVYLFPTTFDGAADEYKHVLHKGYVTPWPLLGPGVFMNASENTMRVVMNTYAQPYSYTDVKNIPINKWVHVSLVCIDKGLDIYINGLIANRIPFNDTLPYQNFQDVIMFSKAKFRLGDRNIPVALNGEKLYVTGSMKGYLSNVIYARYALSITEIQRLMNAGPSAKKADNVMEVPPYLADDWWENAK
jgi:hypothetical protein